MAARKVAGKPPVFDVGDEHRRRQKRQRMMGIMVLLGARDSQFQASMCKT